MFCWLCFAMKRSAKFPVLASVRLLHHLLLHCLPACWFLHVSAPLPFIMIFSKHLKSQHDSCNQRAGLVMEHFFVIYRACSFCHYCSSSCFRSLCYGMVTSLCFFNPALDSIGRNICLIQWQLPQSSHGHLSITLYCYLKTDDRSIYIFGEEPWRNSWKKNADKNQQRVEKRGGMKQELETYYGKMTAKLSKVCNLVDGKEYLTSAIQRSLLEMRWQHAAPDLLLW